MAFPLCTGDRRNPHTAMKSYLNQGSTILGQVLRRAQPQSAIGMLPIHLRFDARGETSELGAWHLMGRIDSAEPQLVLMLGTGNGPLAYATDPNSMFGSSGLNCGILTPSASESSPEDDDEDDDGDDGDDGGDDWDDAEPEGLPSPDIEEWDRK